MRALNNPRAHFKQSAARASALSSRYFSGRLLRKLRVSAQSVSVRREAVWGLTDRTPITPAACLPIPERVRDGSIARLRPNSRLFACRAAAQWKKIYFWVVFFFQENTFYYPNKVVLKRLQKSNFFVTKQNNLIWFVLIHLHKSQVEESCYRRPCCWGASPPWSPPPLTCHAWINCGEAPSGVYVWLLHDDEGESPIIRTCRPGDPMSS